MTHLAFIYILTRPLKMEGDESLQFCYIFQWTVPELEISSTHRRTDPWLRMWNSNRTSLNIVTYKMIIKCDVLHSRMENRIRTKVRRTYIVTIYDMWWWYCDAEFSKERTHPAKFRCCGCNRSVFGFGGGASHTLLFLGRPRYWSGAKIEDVCICGDIIITITCPIRIWKSM